MPFRAAGGPQGHRAEDGAIMSLAPPEAFRGIEAEGGVIMLLPPPRRPGGTSGIDDRHIKKINQT